LLLLLLMLLMLLLLLVLLLLLLLSLMGRSIEATGLRVLLAWVRSIVSLALLVWLLLLLLLLVLLLRKVIHLLLGRLVKAIEPEALTTFSSVSPIPFSFAGAPFVRVFAPFLSAIPFFATRSI